MIRPIKLKASARPYAVAEVTTEAGLIKLLVTGQSPRMTIDLDLHPETALALSEAFIAASRQAIFNRLDQITNQTGAA
jgi:hypothetical protein